MGRVQELQELLEKQSFELSQARERLVTLTAAVAELEEDLGTARRDLIKSEELSSRRQRDLREVGEGLACPSCRVQACGSQEGSCLGALGSGRAGKCETEHLVGCDGGRSGRRDRRRPYTGRPVWRRCSPPAVSGEGQLGRGQEKEMTSHRSPRLLPRLWPRRRTWRSGSPHWKSAT